MRSSELPVDGAAAPDELSLLLSRLDPLDLRIVHLAVSRAAELEAAGQSEAAETVLREVHDIVRRPRSAHRPAVAVC